MIWILFYYNSLPDMPEGCRLFSNEIMHRDFFMCNPMNTGHYQYPRFEDLSYDEGCHRQEVIKFLKKPDQDKYVIFYTRHTSLSKDSENKIVGYFKVGRQFEKPKQGFYAKEAVLLPKNNCIKISYNGRGVPVSWGNSQIKDFVEKKLKDLITMVKSPINIKEKYRQEAKRIMDMLKNKREEIIDCCEKCNVKDNCYWGRESTIEKRKKLKKLYGDKQNC